jgi:hypothetical protein
MAVSSPGGGEIGTPGSLLSTIAPFHSSRLTSGKMKRHLDQENDCTNHNHPNHQLVQAPVQPWILGVLGHCFQLPPSSGPAKGAAQEVMDEALPPFPVTGFQPDALIDAEAGVFPAPDVLDHFLGNLAFTQQQREDLLFPELEERFGGHLGQREEGAAVWGRNTPSLTRA